MTAQAAWAIGLACLACGLGIGGVLGFGIGRIGRDARVFQRGHEAGWDARDAKDDDDGDDDHPSPAAGCADSSLLAWGEQLTDEWGVG